MAVAQELLVILGLLLEAEEEVLYQHPMLVLVSSSVVFHQVYQVVLLNLMVNLVAHEHLMSLMEAVGREDGVADQGAEVVAVVLKPEAAVVRHSKVAPVAVVVALFVPLMLQEPVVLEVQFPVDEQVEEL